MLAPVRGPRSCPEALSRGPCPEADSESWPLSRGAADSSTNFCPELGGHRQPSPGRHPHSFCPHATHGVMMDVIYDDEDVSKSNPRSRLRLSFYFLYRELPGRRVGRGGSRSPPLLFDFPHRKVRRHVEKFDATSKSSMPRRKVRCHVEQFDATPKTSMWKIEKLGVT